AAHHGLLCFASSSFTLLQRIVFDADEIGSVIGGPWIRTLALSKGLFGHALSAHQTGGSVVSFDAARLVVNSVFRVALPGELLLHSPRASPDRGIFDGDHIFEGIGAGARPALDEVQIFARTLEICFGTEIRDVDDQGISLPVATRIAIPLANSRGQVRASVHDDVALPALALADVVEHGDPARGLDDATETAGSAAEFGQSAGQAAVGQCAIFRAVAAIHARGVVARRKLVESRGRNRIVFSASAADGFVFAGRGRLQKRETKLTIGGGDLLSFGSKRRDAPIGRVYDERGARARMLDGHELRIVGAG